MAINSNFVFADPALQAQVVNAQRVQAEAEAARSQQMAQTLAELSRQRRERADLQERRADRAADIRRLDATEAERRRQFDVTTGLTREDIASREKIAGGRYQEADERELYNNLLNFIEKTEDIPTISEWEARIVDISDQRKKELRNRREMRFKSAVKDFDTVVGEVGRLNKALENQEKDKSGNILTIDQLIARSRYKNFIDIDPDTGLARGMLRQPRNDAASAPVPFRVPAGTGFEETAEPLEDFGAVKSAIGRGELLHVGGPPGAEPIASVLGRLNRQSTPPAPVIAPSQEPWPPENIRQFFYRPPAGALRNRGILAPLDYTGPEYDYSTRFRVPEPLPEDFLAPPVFAPGY